MGLGAVLQGTILFDAFPAMFSFEDNSGLSVWIYLCVMGGAPSPV